jgi:tetratricopeptide (TPR) repeat protein
MKRKLINALWLVPLLGLAGSSPTLSWPQEAARKSVPSVAAARAAISSGKLESAETTLWNVLASDPNQPEALTLLGIIRGRQKRYAEAESLLRRALELDPTSLTTRRNLASLMIAQNNPDAAIEQYKQIVKLAPSDVEAKLELSRLYCSAGLFTAALSTLDSIPKNRLRPAAVPVRAASLLALGRRQDAAATIPRVKESPAIAIELAEVFLQGQAPELAIQTLDEVSPHLHPVPARAYYLRGLALQATGNISVALKELRMALARDPKFVDALLAIAAIQASQNKHEDSLASLKRAHSLDPDSLQVLRPLIVEGVKAGEPRIASSAAHVLASKNPENLDDLYLSAAAMLEGKDFETASSIFEKYVTQRPTDSKGLLGLGIAQLAQQHYAEAKSALQRALQLDPKLADAEYQLGVLADREGASSESLQHFERAVQLQPQHAKALASLGAQYLQAGDLESARGALERSLLADPNNPRAHYDLALVLSKLGITEEAKQHMERSRALRIAEDLGKGRRQPKKASDEIRQ